MTYRRLITALVLIAFLPAAAGCSRSRTIGVADEPADSSSTSRFLAGEPVEISGYTRADDGFRKWSGVVRLAEPDSFEFTGKALDGEPAPHFALHTSEVTSIRAIESDQVATTILVVASVVAVGVAVAAATFSAAMSGFGE